MYFLRQKYNIKPAMWGPPSQVEWVVRDYYENTLGVAAPGLFLAALEGAGATLYNLGKSTPSAMTIVNPGSWNNGGVNFSQALSTYSETQSLFGITGYPFTFVATFVPIDGYDPGGEIISFWRYNSILRRYSIAFGTQTSDTYQIIAKGGGVTSATLSANNAVLFGKEQTLIGTFRSETDRELFIDGVSAASSNTSVIDPVTATATETSIGRRGGSADDSYANIVVKTLAIAPAAFSTDQAAIYSATPYAAIQPRSFPSYFFVTTGGPEVTAPTSTLYGPLMGPFGGPI